MEKFIHSMNSFRIYCDQYSQHSDETTLFTYQDYTGNDLDDVLEVGHHFIDTLAWNTLLNLQFFRKL